MCTAQGAAQATKEKAAETVQQTKEALQHTGQKAKVARHLPVAYLSGNGCTVCALNLVNTETGNKLALLPCLQETAAGAYDRTKETLSRGAQATKESTQQVSSLTAPCPWRIWQARILPFPMLLCRESLQTCL